jgi:hypothetical protein
LFLAEFSRLLRREDELPVLRVHIQHQSMEFSDGDKKFMVDAVRALSRMADSWGGPGRPPASITSFGEVDTVERRALLKSLCRERGLRIVAPRGRGALFIAVHPRIGKIKRRVAEHVLDAAPSRPGLFGHGPRPNLSVTIDTDGYGRLSHVVSHFVAGKEWVRVAQRGFQMRRLAARVRFLSRGGRKCTWAVDTNVDRDDDGGAKFYRTMKRLGLVPAEGDAPTQGDRDIDQLGLSARDGKMSVVDVQTWPVGNSDHRARSVWVDIRPKNTN